MSTVCSALYSSSPGNRDVQVLLRAIAALGPV